MPVHPIACLPASSLLAPPGSRHNLRAQGVKTPARSFRHPPAIHHDDAGPCRDVRGDLRMQLGPGSAEGVCGLGVAMISTQLHLTALALAEAADVALLTAFLEHQREVLAIGAHVAGLGPAIPRLANVLLAGLA